MMVDDYGTVKTVTMNKDDEDKLLGLNTLRRYERLPLSGTPANRVNLGQDVREKEVKRT